jgi:hypothetical protein
MDIDVLKAQLVRHDIRQSWGFALHGGSDHEEPLTVTAVRSISSACEIDTPYCCYVLNLLKCF